MSKNMLGAIIIVVVVIGFIAAKQGESAPEATPAPLMSFANVATASPTAESTPTIQPTPTEVSLVWVYVSGAVQAPGVYALAPEGRINDAITAAGGFKADASPEHINLAARIHDEQQIYVPYRDEATAISLLSQPKPTQSSQSQVQTTNEGLVNLNTASVTELESLPKIGPATAQRIIEYRETNGPFTTIEDLRNVKGIGASTYAQLEPLITVQ